MLWNLSLGASAARVIHQGGKGIDLQTRPAHQRPVNFFLRHQRTDVVRFDAATVQNPDAPRRAFAELLASKAAQETMRLRSHFRCGSASGADGPHRLVSNYDTGKVLGGQPGQAAAEVTLEDFFGFALFTFRQRFPHANDRRESSRERRFHFLVYLLVGFAAVMPTLGMPDDHVGASGVPEHPG